MQETEQRNPKSVNIDKADVSEMLRIINEENACSVLAVERALPDIAKAVDAVARAFIAGGRLIYVGCGTSGRLAMADAAECSPTFGVDPKTVIAVMAGGLSAVRTPSEGEEDSAEKGMSDILAENVTDKDVVMGISAGGNARYVVSAMEVAKEKGCVLISLSCNEPCSIGKIADIAICTHTGAEVITGSTRMKAGNAQKMVLNMITTCAMVKTGKVYSNLMINLRPSNIKLKKRMTDIVEEIYGTDEAGAQRMLEKYNYDIAAMLDSETANGV